MWWGEIGRGGCKLTMHEQETHAPRQMAEGTVRGKREVGSRAARRGATAFGDTPP
jgi:hypothetical protein